MVFKFERKSTEKKCEKRKKWCLLWKKFCNNRNLSECMCKLRQMLTFFLEHKWREWHKFILIFNLCHSRHLCFIPETLTV